jgi:hypothetical protein
MSKQNNMWQAIRIIFPVLLVLVSFGFASTAAAAQYSVSPLIIDLELEKRDIVTKDVTITNKDANQIRVFASVNEVSLDENGAIKEFVQPSMVDDRSSSVTSWIQVTRKRIEIPPGESVTIPVTFKVHPDVQSGEYHAVIGFAEGSNQPEAVSKVMNGVAPVVAVRIGVDKVQNQFLRLERFSVKRFVTERTENEILYALQNPGDDPVTPAGEIIIYDNNGTEVASVPVNPDKLTAEPSKSIEITAGMPEELGVGKYKAFLSVEYGEHLTATVHDTAFFYVMPLRQLLIFFAVALVGALLVALFVHRRFLRTEEYDDEMLADVPLYIRTDRSESKDHDIDLSKNKKD